MGITAVNGSQDYVDSIIKPQIFGGENYNLLAELGIGTNPIITAAYIAEHGWSPLLAEKIIGSAHFANGKNTYADDKAKGIILGGNEVDRHIDWVVPGVRIEYLSRKS